MSSKEDNVSKLSRKLDESQIDTSLKLLSLRNQYIPEFYDLHLNINHLKPNFNGTVTIDIKKNENYHGSFNEFRFTLHCNKLIITKAILNDGGKATDLKVEYDRGRHEVSLTINSSYEWKSPEKAKITLLYMGQINTIKTYKDQTKGLFKTNYLDSISGKSNNYILATHTQPHSCKLIFPLVDELNFKVPIKLTIDTLSSFKVLSNSSLIAEPCPVPMSKNATFAFKPTPPIASSVFGFIIGDLEYLENSDDVIPVRMYAPIGTLSSCSYPLYVISSLLPILQQLLNIKYPLDKLDFVALPFLSDGATENWGLVTVLSSQLLIDESSHESVKLQLRQLIAHELVHQWVGNLISFDDWSNLWLNESFATWLGNYLLHVARLDKADYENDAFEMKLLRDQETIMDQDCFYDESTGSSSLPSIHQITSGMKSSLSDCTQDLFDKTAYEKGIILLSMIGSILENENLSRDDCSKTNYSNMLKGVAKAIEKYRFKNIKPFDLWNVLNEFTSIDLLSFVHSWVRYPGYPIVNVTSKGDKIVIEQHRYLFNNRAQDFELEDTPFHLPLSIKCIDDKKNIKILNIMLTDRNLEVPVPLDQFITLNSNKSGYYKVVYSQEFIPHVCTNIINNNFTPQEIISIINDYGKLLGQENSTSQHLVAIFAVLNCFTYSKWEINYNVLKVGLDYLETISNIFLHFSSYSEYEGWLENYITKLYNKIANWESLYQLTSDYSLIEMEVRNLVLHIGLGILKFQDISRKMFKNFINPNSNKPFTPMELLPSIFNLTMIQANQKEYKQILQLVKNSNSSSLNNSNSSIEQLQTVAVSSLSFAENEDLLSKSLNFVMTNIDSKLIELALIGFQFKRSKQDILKLWHWYKLHYDQWTLKSLRKGSDWSKQLAITMTNISKIVLGDLMQYHSDLVSMKEEFIKEKLQKLPEHGLKDLVQNIDVANIEKQAIGMFYNDLIKNLP